LTRLYLQVDGGSDPMDVLGLQDGASLTDAKTAYRALALRLHPDKVTDEGLEATHTRLFQKVQAAYDILEDQGLWEPEDEPVKFKTKPRLPETEAALHARNIQFKEDLKTVRKDALKDKQLADAIARKRVEKLKERIRKKETELRRLALLRKAKVSRAINRAAVSQKRIDMTKVRNGKGQQKKLQKKSGDLSHDKPVEESRVAAIQKRVDMTKVRNGRGQQRNLQKRSGDLSHDEQIEESRAAAIQKGIDKTKVRNGEGQQKNLQKRSGDLSHDEKVEESRAALRVDLNQAYVDQEDEERWQEELDRFIECNWQKPMYRRHKSKKSKSRYDSGGGNALCTPADIKFRWTCALLAGSTPSVSLSQKSDRDKSGAAQALKVEKRLAEYAEGMWRPAMKGNATFCFADYQDVLDAIYENEQYGVDKRVDDGLKMLGDDVLDEYYLEGPLPALTYDFGCMLLLED